MSQELFEKTEFVSSDDPNIDQSELVYMGSDSEESYLLQEVVHQQQEPDDDRNPIHVSVRGEKKHSEDEIAAMLAIINEPSDNMGGFEDLGDLVHTGIERDPIISIIHEEEIDESSVPFDFSDEIITKVEPPDDMPEPPPMTQMFKIEEGEHQFEIISKPIDVFKIEPEDPPKDEAVTQPSHTNVPENTVREANGELQTNGKEGKKTEEGGESPDTSVASGGNTSLMDHPYSQSETNGNEFCDDLLQDLLKETGNENNRSAVQLLTMYTGLFESFFEDDENSQRSLYIQNMKKSLGKIDTKETGTAKPKEKQIVKIPERRCSEPIKSESKLSAIDYFHPRFSDVPESESEKLTETIDLTTQIDLAPTQSTESTDTNESVIVELHEVSFDQDGKLELQVDSEAVTKLKKQVCRVAGLGNKIVVEIGKLRVVNDENIVELQGKLKTLLKESKKEIREISADCLASSRSAADINEENKARLVSASTDDLSSDSDNESLKKRRKKVSKTQPVVVSSTKEDSDTTDIGGTKAEEVEEMFESDDSKDLRDPNKEIDKLLDFTTLDNAKPERSSSRKVSKQKKFKKLKKRKSSDSDSLLTSSSDESRESSSTDNDGEKTDEEEKMRLRQNDNARDDLLADSDAVESDYSDQSGLSIFFSSEDEAEGSKKVKEKSKPRPQKASVESSDDETSISNDEENKKQENGLKITPELERSAVEVNPAKDAGEDAEDEVEAKKKRIMRDSEEREIFSKNFLEETPNNKKTTTTQSNSTISPHSPSKRGIKTENSSQEKFSGTSPDDKGLIDLSMFHHKRTPTDIDMDIFEPRSNRHDGAGPSNANKRPPPAAILEDDCIYLSSDSEISEISAPASGSGSTSTIPKRKKMLSEEELQEETKRAQKEETKRIERLKKKDERLSELMTQRMSQESGASDYEELILDYNPKTKQTISVHEKLVRSLKEHQREGIKFMYDTCFGSIGDEVKTESGCILAHCMGLGKTLQLITLLHTLISHPETLKIDKVIVICPKSTIMNWYEEFGKWLKDIPSRNLKIFFFKDVMQMNEKIKLVEEWFNWKSPSVFLVNYESFRYMVHYSGSKRTKIPEPEEEVKRKQEIISRCLLSPGPDLVVCDEGHTIKNQSSATNRAIVKIKTRRRIVLSGTPVQNNLNEYYSMVDWIKPALLGTVKEFNNLYANPIKDGQHIDSTPQMIKKMKQRSFVLNRNLSKFVQRKEVSVLQQYLPLLHQYCLFIPLTKVQETLYENFLKLNPLDGGHQLLNDYTALRKIWTHPKVLQNAYERAVSGDLKIDENRKRKDNRLADEEDNDEPDDQLDIIDGNTGVKSEWWKQFVSEDDLEAVMSSNKLLTLFYILDRCYRMNQKCLVFSSFVAVLNVVEYFMKKIHNHRADANSQKYGYDAFKIGGMDMSWINGLDYCRLDGSTKREHRQKMIQLFNDPKNPRLRCFLISSKAGGQGINLTGASRCVILDTAWNPSSDQQNIFRIYRLGQKQPCFVYRLIALGTMEEKVYSRSVTKQAMSGRVVDKRQIDRHYKMSELSELYVLTKTDHNARPKPQVPADELLKFLLHTYPGQVYKYHDHERLLENKPDEDLNDDEKNEAWQLYEAELSGHPRVAPTNPLLNNDNFRPNMMANLNFLAAAAATSSSAIDTSGLFSKFYQPPSFYPSDFLHNLLPYDLSGSYRNTLNPLATSPNSSLTSTSQGTAAMLRTQLNANLPPPLFGPYPPLYNLPKPTTSPKPQSTARRPSNTTKSSSLVGITKVINPRNNGNILERLSSHDLLLGKNSSENLVILPDDDSNDSLDVPKTSSSNKAAPKDGFVPKIITNIVHKESLGSKSSSFDKNSVSSIQPKKIVTSRPNLNVPRPQQAHLASMPSRNSSSLSNSPGTAARTHAIPETSTSGFMKVKSTSSLAVNQLQPGSLLLPNVVPRDNSSDHIYINQRTKTGSATSPIKITQKSSNFQTATQRSHQNQVQPHRPASVPAPPVPSAVKQVRRKNLHNVLRKSINQDVNRLTPTLVSAAETTPSVQQPVPVIQRGFPTNLSKKQQPSPQTQKSPISIQNAYSLSKDPLSAASTSSSSSQQTSASKNLPKQSFIPQNRSVFTPQSKINLSSATSKPMKLDKTAQQRLIDQVVAQQKKRNNMQQTKYKIVQSINGKAVNGAGPSPHVPKVVENSVSITKIMPRTDSKTVTIPKNLQSLPSGSNIAVAPRSLPQTSTQMSQQIVAKNPPQIISRIAGPTVVRSPAQPLSKGSPKIIYQRMSQSNAAGTSNTIGASNSQPRVISLPQASQNSQNRAIVGVKRKNEFTTSPEAPKRFALGLDRVMKIIPREERERMQQNTPSKIEDIVEIE